MVYDEQALEGLSVKALHEPIHRGLVTLCKDIPLQYQGQTPRCGPYATAMALNYWIPDMFAGDSVGNDMPWRIPESIPLIGGATMPRGISKYMEEWNFGSTAQRGESADSLRQYIQAGIPCITLIAPNADWIRGHYRVAVAFDEDRLYFNDPAFPSEPHSKLGNLVLTDQEFMHEWDSVGCGIFHNWFLPVRPLQFDPAGTK